MEISILLIGDAASAVEYVATVWAVRGAFRSVAGHAAMMGAEGPHGLGPELQGRRRRQAVVLWDEVLGWPTGMRTRRVAGAGTSRDAASS